MSQAVVPIDSVEKQILLIRGHRVILDSDLARMYGVATKVLLQSVKRNRSRFPADFMFQLTKGELVNLRSQIVTSRDSYGGRRFLPFVFTEEGVAMLSGVLRSNRAIRVNIAIMRAFVRLREITSAHKEFALKLRELEQRIGTHDGHLRTIFEALRQLMQPPQKPGRKIGF